jgi:DeoR/GlpR family transcriptional regulator of sugar metabolism
MRKNRFSQILELLTDQKKIDVVKLSKLCNVSQVTIRKDLDILEEKGLVKRIHGYAEINNADDINGRLAYHYDEKMKIAQKASELVHDGDTIMIESGSCCALVASILSNTKQNLTIVTNSAYIAESLRNTQTNVILLGGIYQKDSQCLVGPMISDTVKNFHVQYFFIGADGYSSRTGFTNKDQLRAQAVRDMSQSCDTVVVVTESEKFNHIGTVPMNFPSPTIVITDDSISNETKEQLKQNNIDVK